MNGKLIVSLACGASMLAAVGCGGKEKAFVNFSYVVQPTKGLPEGMHVLYIEPAKVGETTDKKWSELAVAIMKELVNESASSFGTKVVLADRRDSQVTFNEADLQAAGMSTSSGTPEGGKLLGAQGAILSTINVKVEEKIGKQATISNIFAAGGGGNNSGFGALDLQTREVDTVTRTMNVQCEFKLLDTANNRQWDYLAAGPFASTERTKASPIFGSSQTAAALTPEDRIIGTLVQQCARQFLSRLMPIRIRVETEVESSGNKNSAMGVRYLRAESWDQALASFQQALTESANDDRSAYGAGVAAEALGQYDRALGYYRTACALKQSSLYMEARDRMNAYATRGR
jgi:hypothetical protein